MNPAKRIGKRSAALLLALIMAAVFLPPACARQPRGQQEDRPRGLVRIALQQHG